MKTIQTISPKDSESGKQDLITKERNLMHKVCKHYPILPPCPFVPPDSNMELKTWCHSCLPQPKFWLVILSKQNCTLFLFFGKTCYARLFLLIPHYLSCKLHPPKTAVHTKRLVYKLHLCISWTWLRSAAKNGAWGRCSHGPTLPRFKQFSEGGRAGY